MLTQTSHKSEDEMASTLLQYLQADHLFKVVSCLPGAEIVALLGTDRRTRFVLTGPAAQEHFEEESLIRWGRGCLLPLNHEATWLQYYLRRIGHRTPLASSLNLLQEKYAEDAYRLLSCCILCWRTNVDEAVEDTICQFFEAYPTPTSAATAHSDDIRAILHPLGLNREISIKRFVPGFLKMGWSDPAELYGCGKYASDSWRIFCLGQHPKNYLYTTVEPDLVAYCLAFKRMMKTDDGCGKLCKVEAEATYPIKQEMEPGIKHEIKRETKHEIERDIKHDIKREMSPEVTKEIKHKIKRDDGQEIERAVKRQIELRDDSEMSQERVSAVRYADVDTGQDAGTVTTRSLKSVAGNSSKSIASVPLRSHEDSSNDGGGKNGKNDVCATYMNSCQRSDTHADEAHFAASIVERTASLRDSSASAVRYAHVDTGHDAGTVTTRSLKSVAGNSPIASVRIQLHEDNSNDGGNTDKENDTGVTNNSCRRSDTNADQAHFAARIIERTESVRDNCAPAVSYDHVDTGHDAERVATRSLKCVAGNNPKAGVPVQSHEDNGTDGGNKDRKNDIGATYMNDSCQSSDSRSDKARFAARIIETTASGRNSRAPNCNVSNNNAAIASDIKSDDSRNSGGNADMRSGASGTSETTGKVINGCRAKRTIHNGMFVTMHHENSRNIFRDLDTASVSDGRTSNSIVSKNDAAIASNSVSNERNNRSSDTGMHSHASGTFERTGMVINNSRANRATHHTMFVPSNNDVRSNVHRNVNIARNDPRVAERTTVVDNEITAESATQRQRSTRGPCAVRCNAGTFADNSRVWRTSSSSNTDLVRRDSSATFNSVRAFNHGIDRTSSANNTIVTDNIKNVNTGNASPRVDGARCATGYVIRTDVVRKTETAVRSQNGVSRSRVDRNDDSTLAEEINSSSRSSGNTVRRRHAIGDVERTTRVVHDSNTFDSATRSNSNKCVISNSDSNTNSSGHADIIARRVSRSVETTKANPDTVGGVNTTHNHRVNAQRSCVRGRDDRAVECGYLDASRRGGNGDAALRASSAGARTTRTVHTGIPSADGMTTDIDDKTVRDVSGDIGASLPDVPLAVPRTARVNNGITTTAVPKQKGAAVQRRCASRDCDEGPAYGVEGRKSVCCYLHAEDDMITIRKKAKCKQTGCDRPPKFGLEGYNGVITCVRHTRPAMPPLRCLSGKCLRIPSYAVEGAMYPSVCYWHLNTGMAHMQRTNIPAAIGDDAKPQSAPASKPKKRNLRVWWHSQELPDPRKMSKDNDYFPMYGGRDLVYTLRLEGDKWYVGMTGNFSRRMKEHFTGIGAEWTKLHRPLYVSHVQLCPSKEAAMKAETARYLEVRDLYGAAHVRGAGSTITTGCRSISQLNEWGPPRNSNRAMKVCRLSQPLQQLQGEQNQRTKALEGRNMSEATRRTWDTSGQGSVSGTTNVSGNFDTR